MTPPLDPAWVEEACARIDYPVHYACLKGSRLFNTSVPESDIDIIAIHQAPTNDILSLNNVEPPSIRLKYEQDTDEGIVEVDLTSYELSRWLHLLGKSNGNFTESSCVPDGYFSADYIGVILRAIGKQTITRSLHPFYRDYSFRQLARASNQIKSAKGIAYCVTPGHRVLTDDLRWVPVEKLAVGDGLFAFDEDAGRWGRRWKSGVVTASEPVVAEVFEIRLTDGTVLTSTGEHRWLTYSYNRANTWNWTRTDRLMIQSNNSRSGARSGDPRKGIWFRRLMQTWEEDRSYEAGWLAGIFDGEGCLRVYRHRRSGEPTSPAIMFTQNPGEVLDRTNSLLNHFGFEVSECDSRKARTLFLLGGRQEVARFLGQIRPTRLLENLDITTFGGVRLAFGTHAETLQVESIRSLGRQEVVGLSSSTGTYLCEGFGSHNTYRESLTGIHVLLTGEYIFDFHKLCTRTQELLSWESKVLPRLSNTRAEVSLSLIDHAWDEFEYLERVLDEARDQSPLPDSCDLYKKMNDLLLYARYVQWRNPTAIAGIED